MPYLLFGLFWLCLQGLGAQTALNTDTCVWWLGQTPVKLIHWGYDRPTSLTFIALHDNENTCVEAILPLLRRYPGRFIELQATGERWIPCKMPGNKVYSFDPNRIFSDNEQAILLHSFSLNPQLAKQKQKEYLPVIRQEIQPFGQAMLNSLGHSRLVVSLHNNFHQSDYGSYNLTWYLNGRPEASQAEAIYVNPKQRSSDFFVVTERYYFEALRRKGFNVVLQAALPLDDGSLSVYCARQGIPYINIEARHGHVKEQQAMLLALFEVLCEGGLICCD